MIYDNILYQDLIDDIEDRLQHMTGTVIQEETRQLLLAPERLARSCTQALLSFIKVAEASVIPALVLEQTLSAERTYRNVSSYKFTENTFAERADNGMLSVIINGEELPWEQVSSYESVIFRANNVIYGDDDPCFNYDDFKKRIYTPDGVTVALVYVAMPHNIHSSKKDAAVGCELIVTVAPSSVGDVRISDGTNSVTITLAGTETKLEVATAIISAVNSAPIFYFNAYAIDDSNKIQFNISPDAPLNGNVEIGFTDTGTTSTTVTLLNNGTFILPVGKSYYNSLADEFTRQLLAVKLQGSKRSSSSKEPEPQKEQG